MRNEMFAPTIGSALSDLILSYKRIDVADAFTYADTDIGFLIANLQKYMKSQRIL